MKALLTAMTLGILASAAGAADKKIVFLAGKPSHGPGEHEHHAGSLLLAACLTNNIPGVSAVVVSNDWPADESILQDAAAIVVYSDGGRNHPLLRDGRLKTIGALMERGVGLALLHYAVEPGRECGQDEFVDWIGGAFEIHWSVNPFWLATFQSIPAHPVTRGVGPFALFDEWYFNMRFRANMTGVTPLLSAVPTPRTIMRDDGPHSNNPHVRAAVERGDLQHLAWAAERPNGGRGFGYTGGHFHRSWANDNARKLVLNAILWIANIEVPPTGVVSTVTEEQLAANLDPKERR